MSGLKTQSVDLKSANWRTFRLIAKADEVGALQEVLTVFSFELESMRRNESRAMYGQPKTMIRWTSAIDVGRVT